MDWDCYNYLYKGITTYIPTRDIYELLLHLEILHSPMLCAKNHNQSMKSCLMVVVFLSDVCPQSKPLTHPINYTQSNTKVKIKGKNNQTE